MKRRARGFTLMELMVVLSIAGVVLAIGVPNFSRFRLNARMTNTVNDALTSIVKARTEAIRRQQSVSICASSDPLIAAATCTDGATVGFLMFADTNNNCVLDGTDVRLDARAYANDISANPLLVRSNGNCISYAPTGFLQNIAARTRVTRLLYCDNRGLAAAAGTTLSAARGITIALTGRAQVTRDRTSGLSSDVTTWGGGMTCP
ncbi:MAG TPA: GspH/FimT family pseudopilin [Steroidobacteraceae bacterium]|jgi:type IV fimbrial biogenesis protein FimT|nr:GspH/FimT family pseudopilin [Steroidobacteraceae bacterium]